VQANGSRQGKRHSAKTLYKHKCHVGSGSAHLTIFSVAVCQVSILATVILKGQLFEYLSFGSEESQKRFSKGDEQEKNDYPGLFPPLSIPNSLLLQLCHNYDLTFYRKTLDQWL
jgi:hypothetical protein